MADGLTEFLLARIAEDEAQAATPGPRDSTIVLTECEAKRQIVAEHHAVGRSEDGMVACAVCCHQDRNEYGARDAHQYPCPTVRALILPYADHPDYRDEWRQ